MPRVLRIFLVINLLLCPLWAEEEAPPAWWEGVLWYVPNRVMDLMDVFRLRVKMGPGLEVGVRFTDAFAFYGGQSKTFYVGLPGPRQQAVFPAIGGYEQKKGLVLMGVDASDDMPNPPLYEFSEIGASAHFLFIGMDAGFSLVELKDFFTGWFGLDEQKDDFPPRAKPLRLPSGGVLQPAVADLPFPIQEKPAVFSGTHSRLDYLQQNVPLRLQGQMYTLDRSLSDPSRRQLAQPPVTNLRLSLFYESISDPDGSIKLDPNIKLKVDLPNFEDQMSLFVQSSYDDDLPGTDITQRNNKGWTLGFRRQMEKWHISTDVGIHTKWIPELFARTSWEPNWQWDEWKFAYEFRVFWENEDQFGLYNQLQAFHWMGAQDKWLFHSGTAGKFSESTEGLEWQQSESFFHLAQLKDEKRRGGNVGADDTLNGWGINLSVFGKDEQMDKYRSTLLYRKCLYGDFVVLQFEPGLEWRDEHDWTTQYRMDAGLVLLF